MAAGSSRSKVDAGEDVGALDEDGWGTVVSVSLVVEVVDLLGVVVGAGGVIFTTLDRSSVGRGLPTTHRFPPLVSSTVSAIRISPAWVGTVTSAVRAPSGAAVSVLMVGPVMTIGVRGRAAKTYSPGLVEVWRPIALDHFTSDVVVSMKACA